MGPGGGPLAGPRRGSGGGGGGWAREDGRWVARSAPSPISRPVGEVDLPMPSPTDDDCPRCLSHQLIIPRLSPSLRRPDRGPTGKLRSRRLAPLQTKFQDIYQANASTKFKDTACCVLRAACFVLRAKLPPTCPDLFHPKTKTRRHEDEDEGAPAAHRR